MNADEGVRTLVRFDPWACGVLAEWIPRSLRHFVYLRASAL